MARAAADGMGEMSIIVGLDLVQVSAIASSLTSFGRRFLERVYTPAELRYCLQDPGTMATRLAVRFAAKEATLKVLRFRDEAVSWRSIEVDRLPGGACAIVLHDEARAQAIEGRFVGFSLSMTHAADYASAVVVGERSLGAIQ